MNKWRMKYFGGPLDGFTTTQHSAVLAAVATNLHRCGVTASRLGLFGVYRVEAINRKKHRVKLVFIKEEIPKIYEYFVKGWLSQENLR